MEPSLSFQHDEAGPSSVHSRFCFCFLMASPHGVVVLSSRCHIVSMHAHPSNTVAPKKFLPQLVGLPVARIHLWHSLCASTTMVLSSTISRYVHIYSAARVLWTHFCGVDVAEAAAWAAHSWLFSQQHEANTLQIVRAHIRFCGAHLQPLGAAEMVPPRIQPPQLPHLRNLA